MTIRTASDLERYLDLIERERESRPAEAALADEIRRLRTRRSEDHDLLCQILWTEPYASVFKMAGGLPADWLRNGVVTSRTLALIHVKHGVASAWDRQELRAQGVAVDGEAS